MGRLMLAARWTAPVQNTFPSVSWSSIRHHSPPHYCQMTHQRSFIPSSPQDVLDPSVVATCHEISPMHYIVYVDAHLLAALSFLLHSYHLL